ncbi:MAG: hypothetical protein ABIP48_01310 [Planctomycetota bacterium]
MFVFLGFAGLARAAETSAEPQRPPRAAAVNEAANSPIIPPESVTRAHPLHATVERFLRDQKDAMKSHKPTGLGRGDYLRVIAGQVEAIGQYQDGEGRIIDPVEKIEKYYATPCYAHSVAVLAASGQNTDPKLLESGMKAMDVSVADMAGATAAGGHGDFYTWPVMLALEHFAHVTPPTRVAGWEKQLAAIDRTKLYRAGPDSSNWNIVNLSGEYLRAVRGMVDLEYVETCLAAQLKHFTPLGMYDEHGHPLPYDHFPRHYLGGVLAKGYGGASQAAYRDLLWKGAWTSLLIQSPTGELPTGYRSSHHIWNEAEQAVTFEIYATHSAKAGRLDEAGALKRAARLSLASIRRWIRPDGSGYVVKNRYPIDARHGYESYTAHTCYNMLASSMLAQAWQFADESIEERPSPADVGGFAVAILRPFHKVFANAGGTYVEYDTSGDHVYNPTGLIRVHVEGGHPQLGPSDGCAPKYSGKDVNLAVGPEWEDNAGRHRLAAMSPREPTVEILEETPAKVRFRVAYSLETPNATQLVETITVEPSGVTVEDQITGDAVRAMRVTYPMLVFDGLAHTKVDLRGNRLALELDDLGAAFEIIEPEGVELKRTGQTYAHRNGQVEQVEADIPGHRAVYRITAE